MTKTEQHGNRAHVRRKVWPVAYVELGQENGGILLNLSEGGLAVRSALMLGPREFAGLRFQVPTAQGWLTASGRVVWLDDSKKVAGIQFTELPEGARREIRNWACAEGDPGVASDSVPASYAIGRQATKQILDTRDRSGGRDPEPLIARRTQIQAAQAQREQVPAAREAVPLAPTEPPAQAVRFTDYSMFAAEPEREGVWAEPPRSGRRWGATAFLVLLVAALSFFLGSTVGEGTVERLVAYLTSFSEDQLAAPKVTPPAPVEQRVEAAGAAKDQTDMKSTSIGDQPRREEGTNASPGPGANSQPANTPPRAEKKGEEPTAITELKTSSAASGAGAANSTIRSTPAPRIDEPRAGRSAENAMPRDSRTLDAEPNGVVAEHSILVNAPGPGGRPFYVNLPAEAISANPMIAISARRTLEILPAAFSRSERVIIGKLISHSTPFYPAEARSQRIEGSVELRARIGRTGQVIGVTPVSGPALLRSAAAAAVREWHYEPTFVDGDPAETVAEITIVFRLQ
jgi:TonB family protein